MTITMRRSIEFLFLALYIIGSLHWISAEREVTNEQLLGALNSMVNSWNELDNKFERHSYATHATNDLIKRSMIALMKQQKNFEPMNGVFMRLEERVGQVESLLMQQETKFKIQNENLSKALERLFKWMQDNDECMKRPPLPGGLPKAVAIPPAPPAILTEFMSQQQEINKKLLDQINRLSTNVDKLLDHSKDMMQQTEVAFKSMPSTAEMLTKIEDKLVSYSVVTPAPADNAEFENRMLEKFGEISNNMAELRQSVPQVVAGLNTADKQFIQQLNNETLSALENIRIDALSASDKALVKTTARIKETEGNIDNSLGKVLEGISDSSEVLEKFYSEMNASYSKFNEGLEVFKNLNHVLMANSEYVLDTKRSVEYGAVQIKQKIDQLMEKTREELNNLMKERFDTIDESIVDTQIEAVQNLSSTIETEISHVWHQIEIMHNDISDSTSIIRMMEGRNQVHINNTFDTMDSLSYKVEETKNRMLDMDKNLNYMLGRTALMTSEFEMIKGSFEQTYNDIRTSFQLLKEKIPAQGPGPHNIARNQYETELNLLDKRHTAAAETKN